ncbi:MAG TPA: DUF4333 domain-containing protein [Amycolatopsis sp.]|jgi:hypothetical protein|nr:DUF4333 domain-containing protein [Amycolatopsis sp.]
MLRAVRTSAVALCAAAALSACTVHAGSSTPTISEANLEQGISDALQKSVGQRPDSVKCPGSIDATVGQTARCTLTSGRTSYGLTVKITSYTNGKATYDVQVDSQPVAGSA